MVLIGTGKNTPNAICCMLFIGICAISLCAVSSMLYLYSDDVYYLTFLKSGFDNFVHMNIAHYQHINGRMLVHILDQIILFFGNGLFAAVNTLMIVGFAILSAKCFIADGQPLKKERLYLCISAVLFFILCLPHGVTSQTIYWITGSMNYMLPAFMAMLMYYLVKRNMNGHKNTAAVLLFALLAGATTEQGGFVAVLLSALLVLTTWRHDSAFQLKRHTAPPIFALAGLLSVVLAPGTFSRMLTCSYDSFSASALCTNILGNITHISVFMAGRAGIAYLLCIAVMAVLFTVRSDKDARAWRLMGMPIVGLMLCQRLFNWYQEALCLTAAALSLIYLTNWAAAALKSKAHPDPAIFMLSAFGLQIFMLASPVLGERTILVTALLIAAAAAGLSIKLIKTYAYTALSAGILAIMLLPLKAAAVLVLFSAVLYFSKRTRQFQLLVPVCIFVLFFAPVIKGYHTNYLILKSNEAGVADAQRSGQLYWNIDLEQPYRHDLFYENSDFEPYFLQLHNLPADTNVYLVSSRHKPLFFDGHRLKHPAVEQDAVYYPLRDVFEAAGAQVRWDDKTDEIAVSLNDIRYSFNAESMTVTDTEGTRVCESPARTFFGRTYVLESVLAPTMQISKDSDKISLSVKQ